MISDLVLGESLEVLIDHRGKTPRKLGTDFVDSGVAVASAILVKNGRLDLSEARFVDEATWRRWMGVPTRTGDVVLTSEAPLGRVGRVTTDEPLVLGQRLYGLRGKVGVLNSGYLFYALQTDQVQADLLGRSTGTTVFGIRQSALRQVVIPAPPFEEQRAIAEVLGALDDKIAANGRTVSTLLDLTVAHFGWAVREATLGATTFGDMATIAGGGTPKTSIESYWGGDILWATPTDVTALDAPYLARTSRTITDDGLIACASSLYPSGSILMTSRATIGAFAIAQRPTAVNQGFIVANAHDPEHQWWLFHEMKSRVPEFLSFANGATFLELPRRRFKQLPVRTATSTIMSAFGAQVEPLHSSAIAFNSESARLAATRDELLPLLMSGRIRVKDAEKTVEGVL